MGRWKVIKNMTHNQLYFDSVDRFIVTGALPIKTSTLPLSRMKPLLFLDKQIRLPESSVLYTTYVGSNADYMLSPFTAHLFMEFASSQNKYLAVEMWEELFINYWAKELKGGDDEFKDSEGLKNNKFQMLKNFQKEFSMSMRERRQNFSEGRDASNKSDRSQIIYQDI